MVASKELKLLPLIKSILIPVHEAFQSFPRPACKLWFLPEKVKHLNGCSRARPSLSAIPRRRKITLRCSASTRMSLALPALFSFVNWLQCSPPSIGAAKCACSPSSATPHSSYPARFRAIVSLFQAKLALVFLPFQKLLLKPSGANARRATVNGATNVAHSEIGANAAVTEMRLAGKVGRKQGRAMSPIQ